MNYEDCYHNDVCGFECDDALTFCKYFKDKSFIVELPCKVGGEAYLISVKRYSPASYKLVKARVIGFNINKGGIYSVVLKTLESDFTFTRHISKVYFDKSEVEAKLKELNKNIYRTY